MRWNVPEALKRGVCPHQTKRQNFHIMNEKFAECEDLPNTEIVCILR
jgi:hypothetical protein